MKNFKKTFSFILSGFLFLIYAVLVTIAPKYFFASFSDNYIVTFFSYLIIFGVSFTLVYGLAKHFKFLSKTLNPLANRNFFDFTRLIDDSENHTSKAASSLIKEGRKIVSLGIFVFILELLFPFAIAYVSMSPFACIASLINFKYFMNMINFESTKQDALKKKDIPNLTSLIEDIKKELGIKRKVYITAGSTSECGLIIENSKIYVNIGIDLLKLLNTKELRALIYSLLLNFSNEDFEINLKLTRYTILINFFNYKAIIPMDLMFSTLFLAKTSFYLQVVSDTHRSNHIVKLKGTPYIEDFLKAKYKKTRYNLVNIYLDPNDYLKIDPDDYFNTHLKMKIEKADELSFIDSMVKVATHNSREIELTYAESRDLLEEKDVEIKQDINSDFEEDYLSFCRKSPLSNKDNVIKKYKRYIDSIDTTKEFEQEFLKEENPSFDDKIQYALGLFLKREYQECLDYSLKLEEENPNDDSLCLLLGNIYIKAFNSRECENYLRRNFFKHEIIITATNLLEDYYCHNGLKDKLKEFEKTIMDAQKILIQDRLESQNVFMGEEDISPINKFSPTNQEIIEKIKEYKDVNHLIMFDKFTDASYHLYIILGVDNLKNQKSIDEIKEYLLNRDDVNAMVKVFTKKDKKILNKFKDHIMY